MKIVAGIDVSKKTLDIHLAGKARQFANSPEGHLRLGRWLVSRSCERAVMEATGSYHLALAEHLLGLGMAVSVVNPAQAKHYARAMGLRNKTDLCDARTLAEFGTRFETPAFQPLDKLKGRLRSMVRMRKDLVEKLSKVRTQLKDPAFSDDLEASVLIAQQALLVSQLEAIESSLRVLVQEQTELREAVANLKSIPGVGEVTAWTFLAELGDVGWFSSAKQVGAYSGLCPRIAQSGKSLASSLSRQGNSALRQVAFLAALAAIRHYNPFRTFFQRLLGAGKSRMSALLAVAHKLVRICFGVLRSGSPFIEERALTPI